MLVEGGGEFGHLDSWIGRRELLWQRPKKLRGCDQASVLMLVLSSVVWSSLVGVGSDDGVDLMRENVVVLMNQVEGIDSF